MQLVPELPWPHGRWRSLLAEAITDVDELLAVLDLEPSSFGERAAAVAACRQLPLRVPRSFVDRMRRSDPTDPLLVQVLPTSVETVTAAGFSVDPVGELTARPADGVLNKYRGRALLMVTGACAVHCRYCFRRHFPYSEHALAGRGWEGAVERIAADPTISEVILSGGDPLTMPDARLAVLAAALDAVGHLRRLRIHTRVPVVLPERIDSELLGWLGATRLQTVVVLHANHGAEVGEELEAAVAALRRVDVTVLNQAVLLRGVNDGVEALVQLSERLFDIGVLPYYLHLLDRVQGAAHFEVPEEEAGRLVAEAAARLPGFLVPRLVREVLGAPSKIPVELWS